MALRFRVSVEPCTVLVVMVPIRLPDESAMPPPDDPSCAAADPPSESTSIEFVAKVNISFTEPKTTVGKSADCICSEIRNCAPYEAITMGVPEAGGNCARVMEGKEEGSNAVVCPEFVEWIALLVTATRAKSYSPVPIGVACERVFGFACIHEGEIYINAPL